MLTGYRTYLAALGLGMLAVYHVYAQKNWLAGLQHGFMALAVFGLRSAIYYKQ